jgi:uncharacterized protein
VLEVDLARKRIALTMMLDEALPKAGAGDNRFRPAGRDERAHRAEPAAAAPAGAMAAAFARLKAR